MRAFLVATLLVLVLAVAGCGGSSSASNGEASKTAHQVLADAAQAARGATSFHLIEQTHFQDTGAPSLVDLTFVKGKGAVGSWTVGPQKEDLVFIGSYGYIKAGADYWTGFGLSSALAQEYAGTWRRFPLSNVRFGEAALADPAPLFDRLASADGTTKGTTTYNGQRVVEIDGGSKFGTVYVAATGTSYPVAIVHAGGARTGGRITFDSWNKPVTVNVPAGAKDFGG